MSISVQGDLYVIPRGVYHQPVSLEGAEVMLIEPTVTVNTGDTPSELTRRPIVVGASDGAEDGRRGGRPQPGQSSYRAARVHHADAPAGA